MTLYSAESRARFFPESCRYDYIVDAIDLVSCKLDLAETARRLGIPLIMALGTGNKLDPSQLRLADIAETYGCPLARVMRKELRNRGIHHQTVVFSPEQPAPTTQPEKAQDILAAAAYDETEVCSMRSAAYELLYRNLPGRLQPVGPMRRDLCDDSGTCGPGRPSRRWSASMAPVRR